VRLLLLLQGAMCSYMMVIHGEAWVTEVTCHFPSGHCG
jgi:hypothetical protein